MDWTVLLSHFFAGAFLVNGIPHFVQGISGNPFQSPFAKPPGVGLSSPMVNVLWGAANFAAAYWLVLAGQLPEYKPTGMLSLTIGALLMAVTLAWHFGRVRGSGQP